MTLHLRIVRLITLLVLCLAFAVPALARGGGGFHFRSSGFHAWRMLASRERGFAAGFHPRKGEPSSPHSAFGGFRASGTRIHPSTRARHFRRNWGVLPQPGEAWQRHGRRSRPARRRNSVALPTAPTALGDSAAKAR